MSRRHRRGRRRLAARPGLDVTSTHAVRKTLALLVFVLVLLNYWPFWIGLLVWFFGFEWIVSKTRSY